MFGQHIDIFHQNTSETTDEHYLINKFAEIANLDSSINKQALTAKLYRYKCKLTGKRVLAENEFEIETISLPVYTVIAPTFPSGKLYEEELCSYKSLNEQKSIKIRETIAIHQYEISSFKRSHYPTTTIFSNQKLMNNKDKMLQKFNFRTTRYESVLLKRSLSRYAEKRASVANNRALQKKKIVRTEIMHCNISLAVQLQHEQENVKRLTEKLTASHIA
ncbi:hypothetical protein ACJMK2_025021 [Sinanodonta woodiana]|uniref:Uncharacterized protein n=1 Tax=Sinanodonta woodiana TaxID=1069815 RepID=A0ABD3XFN3_SINWO